MKNERTRAAHEAAEKNQVNEELEHISAPVTDSPFAGYIGSVWADYFDRSGKSEENAKKMVVDKIEATEGAYLDIAAGGSRTVFDINEELRKRGKEPKAYRMDMVYGEKEKTHEDQEVNAVDIAGDALRLPIKNETLQEVTARGFVQHMTEPYIVHEGTEQERDIRDIFTERTTMNFNLAKINGRISELQGLIESEQSKNAEGEKIAQYQKELERLQQEGAVLGENLMRLEQEHGEDLSLHLQYDLEKFDQLCKEVHRALKRDGEFRIAPFEIGKLLSFEMQGDYVLPVDVDRNITRIKKFLEIVSAFSCVSYYDFGVRNVRYLQTVIEDYLGEANDEAKELVSKLKETFNNSFPETGCLILKK